MRRDLDLGRQVVLDIGGRVQPDGFSHGYVRSMINRILFCGLLRGLEGTFTIQEE